MSLPLPTWGQATLFRLGTDQTYPVRYTPDGPACQLEFGRELVCELRPHGSELAGDWRFGLHQLLALPAGAPATLRYELRLFVYKPAGAFVSVQLKTARQVQALPFQGEAEGELLLTATAPLVLAHGGCHGIEHGAGGFFYHGRVGQPAGNRPEAIEPLAAGLVGFAGFHLGQFWGQHCWISAQGEQVEQDGASVQGHAQPGGVAGSPLGGGRHIGEY